MDLPGEAIVEMLGSDTVVHLRIADRTIVLRDSRARRIKRGETVRASSSEADRHVFGASGPPSRSAAA